MQKLVPPLRRLQKETFRVQWNTSIDSRCYMSKAIKLSEELVSDAITNGKAQHRSAPKQIEYWARIGKLADENPDLPLSFIKGLLVGIEEVKAGDVSEYEFG